jgi:hypothetical protein
MAQMAVLGTRLWNAPTYALLEVDGDAPLTFHFASSSFLRYRFGTALVGDELLDALAAMDGDWRTVLDCSATLLPLRNELLPRLADLRNLRTRIAGGGIGVVFAVASGGEFLIPWQERSQEVADGAGRSSVVPLAYHQPVIGDAAESHPYWTVLRELYEECFRGKEADRDPLGLIYNWYLRRSGPVDYLHEHRDSVVFSLNGIGLNSFNGNYEMAVGVTVQEEEFWSRFGDLAEHNWEIGRWTLLHTKDAESLREALADSNQMQESRFALAQAIIALRERYPERMARMDVRLSMA